MASRIVGLVNGDTADGGVAETLIGTGNNIGDVHVQNQGVGRIGGDGQNPFAPPALNREGVSPLVGLASNMLPVFGDTGKHLPLAAEAPVKEGGGSYTEADTTAFGLKRLPIGVGFFIVLAHCHAMQYRGSVEGVVVKIGKMVLR